jgi:fructose-1,6-bisphosphatase-3
MEELALFGDVDIEWGNHDIHWMGAVCGNEACIANVVRLAISYNNFDLLEDGYGINLRPLSSFAAQTYKDDPCLPFQPHLLDDNIYDPIDAELAAKMHKAIAVIQFKLEAQLIARHPEYDMDGRALLRFVDFEKGEVEIDGARCPLRDICFPTVDPKDPLQLLAGEQEVMHAFRRSFTRAGLLGRHIRYLYNNGSMYKIANDNLLYHGCVPMDDEGNFLQVLLDGQKLSGRAYLDAIDAKIRTAYFAPEGSAARANAGDYMWYLWCGQHSPLFGKSCMTTFERYFVTDKATHAEEQDPYYKHVQHREACEKILREFGLDPAISHIINGHVPVRRPKGERPVRGGGLLFVIDGGISKAYHGRTGIGGYTLISNSHNLALAEHPPFEDVKNSNFRITPKVRMVERFARRVTVRQTDTGRRLQKDIEQLSELLAAYRDGTLQEKV